jgi:hypothetical protein
MRANPELRRLTAIAAGLAVAIALPLSVGLGWLGPMGLLVMLTISLSIAALGRALLLTLQWPSDAPGTAAIEVVAGSAMLSVLSFFVMVNAGLTMSVLLALVAGASVALWALASRMRPSVPKVRPALIDASVLVLASALAALWNRELLGSMATLADTGVFVG